MATIILTAVGTVFGGPLGGALGALAGQAVDGAILRPKGREGPRLSDLAVATSSYGTPIPRLYGTIRVGGSVVWSTDLIEHAATGGGGKSRGGTTTYSYSASFATLLSARAIAGVRRIWADGKLLRGAAGDLKTAGKLRVYLGDEAQGPDPLIASAEGLAMTPALRGQAYAVFEDLALADFGNRIPSLTFEVVADERDVIAGEIVADASGGLVTAGEDDLRLGGYAAYGDSLRGGIAGLAAASGSWLAPVGTGFVTRRGAGAARVLADDGRGGRSIAAADTAAGTAIVAHYDPARDYQTGVQRAVRPGGGRRALRIDLPAATGAATAKMLAADALARADTARERRRLVLDWRAIGVTPGERVRIAGEAGLWRVAGWTLEAMVLTLELERLVRAPIAVAASPGRVRAAPDLIAGRTVLHAFEVPPTDDRVLAAPQLTIAAAGTGAGWRGAALQISSDGDRWEPVAAATRAATLGIVVQPAPAAPATLVDRRGAIEVTLARADMTLADADDAALDGGANLAAVGDELVQFARAERIGERRWRLTGLWRGRRGTEAAMAGTRAGDRFVLLDPATLLRVALPLSAIGARVSVLAAGVGDGDDPVRAQAAITGISVAPPGPVHLSLSDATLRWTRRSRGGWRWNDGVDAPLVEEAERYALTPLPPTVSAPLVATAALAELPPGWRDSGGVVVRQIGTLAASAPATISFT